MIDGTALRRFVYDRLVATGKPPLLEQIARNFDVSTAAARECIATLGVGKAILPHPATGEIWMAGPFAADPTPYVVRVGQLRYYANCAWDMLGIPALLGAGADIEAVCTDCGSPMPMKVDPDRGPDVDALVHFLLPARHWYDDIGFT